MALVPYTITALAESDSQGTDGKNIVAGAVCSMYSQPSDSVVTLYDDAAGSNGSTSKVTGANGQVVVYVEQGRYRLNVNASDSFVTVSSDVPIDVDTFANLAASSPVQDGQRFICQERANANYILQPSGYVALTGDVTFANGRVGELQMSTEGWNFYHFNVGQSNTATQNTTAFQSAIERAGNSPICGAGGFFNIDGQLTLSENSSGIVSTDGRYIDLKQATDGLSCLKVSPDAPDLGSTVNNIKIRDVRLLKSTSTANQVALDLVSANSVDIVNLSTLGCHTAVKIRGCKNIRGNNWLLFAGGGNITYQSGTALIDCDEYPLNAGGYTPFWTSSISNLTASCENLCDYVFDIAYADGFHLSNGYIASPKSSHFRLKPRRDNGGIAKLLVDNFYMDGINTTTGSEGAVRVPSDGLTGTFVTESKFSNCGMSNFIDNIVNVTRSVFGLEFNGCTFSNSQGLALSASVSSGGTLCVTGGEVSNTGIDGVSGGIYMEGVGAAKIVAVDFRGVPQSDAVRTVNCGRVITDSNIFSSVSNAYSDTGSLKVSRVGSLSSTQTLYNETGMVESWTPSVSFGGASVGVTYTVQLGSIYKIGKCVSFTCYIQLSSKGSSVGDIAITGLPFVNQSNYSSVTCELRTVTAGVGDQHIQGGIVSSGTGITMSNIAASGFRDNLNNADFTNTSIISISGTYFEA